MQEVLKRFFATLAGVDPSDIEIFAGEESEHVQRQHKKLLLYLQTKL